jgi:hypothetical protein
MHLISSYGTGAILAGALGAHALVTAVLIALVVAIGRGRDPLPAAPDATVRGSRGGRRVPRTAAARARLAASPYSVECR